MTRMLRRLGAVAVAVATVLPAGAGATATRRGVLTAVEFRQLSTEQARFRTLEHRRQLTWNDLYALCGTVGHSTRLLQRVHANCESGVGIDRALSGFFGDLQRCAALSTATTTGTTTTGSATSTSTTPAGPGAPPVTTPAGAASPPLTAPELKLFACLEPEYAVIGRAVRATYAAQTALRAQVLVRGFSGRCRQTLAPSSEQLTALRQFVRTSRRLAADVALISRVADGTAPASVLSDAKLAQDSAAFTAAGRDFERLHRPQTLAACPHR